MKLLIVDTAFPKGHNKLNNYLLNLLSEVEYIDSIKVLNYQNYYHNENKKIKCNYTIPLLLRCKKAYVDYLFQFINTLFVTIRCCAIKSDKVFFFTFDTLSSVLLCLGILPPIYLFHHNNTDHLQNKYKRAFFRLYMNHVKHIVFAEFIRDYLLSLGVDKDKVYVLPHPLLFSEKKVRSDLHDINIRVYIALGHANDEALIQELIASELQTRNLENNHVKLIIRSVSFHKDLPKSIEIINGYLSQEEYDYYYEMASGVLILYPEHFKNRFSGALLDALKAKKIVIGRNLPIVNYFHSKFPECCIVFNEIPDLINKLSCNSTAFDDITYEKFLSFYSDEKIKYKLNEILL